jgi:hypothetical protein
MSGQLAVGSVSQSFGNLPSDNGNTFTTLLASYSSALTAGHTDTAALNLASDAGNVSGNVNIDIVGPAFSSSGSTANFPQGAQGGFFVTLANNSTYTAIPTLSDLDILGVSITNDPSGPFSVSQQNVTQPQLTAGASERIAVGFLGTTQPGNYFADLEVHTDQDADYQAAGDVFDVQLSVDVAPEPSTAGLLAAAGALFLGRRRRKVGLKADSTAAAFKY